MQFEPFQRILYRYSQESQWLPGFYASVDDTTEGKHLIIGGVCSFFVIPYHGNEWLLGRADAPEDKREYHWGDKVEVRLDGSWHKGLYRCSSFTMHSVYVGCRSYEVDYKDIRQLESENDGNA